MGQVKRLIPNLSEEDIQRFWSNVANSFTGDPEPCWPWLGERQRPRNYGVDRHRPTLPYGICALPGGSHPAHRVAYFIWTGQQPGRLVVRHTCHNPGCCNPYHLCLGSAKDNVDDMKRAGRDNFWGYRERNQKLTCDS